MCSWRECEMKINSGKKQVGWNVGMFEMQVAEPEHNNSSSEIATIIWWIDTVKQTNKQNLGSSVK